jgi:hypothetical protein
MPPGAKAIEHRQGVSVSCRKQRFRRFLRSLMVLAKVCWERPQPTIGLRRPWHLSAARRRQISSAS